ncbi:MAG: hypothetical protein NTW31_14280 [Bacteroidetes bacterium]|nr:hypothetical protein [Bacteroidota bacterium]
MDTEEMVNDDFLSDLLRKMPLESPSDEFINKVMAGIEPLPSLVTEKKPNFLWLKSSLPFIGLGIFVLLIIFSSDIPYLNLNYGRDYFSVIYIKAFQPFIVSMKTMFSSKFITYSLLIGVSAGFLFIIDKLFSRRFAALIHLTDDPRPDTTSLVCIFSTGATC